jgi:serine protease inhibitor
MAACRSDRGERLERDTGAVVTSALRFAASWTGRFWAPATRDAAFVLADGTEVTVPMMGHGRCVLRHAENDAWQFVQKPLEGGFVVDFILPRPGSPMAAAVRTLLDGSAAEHAVEASVDLWLPRFAVASARGPTTGAVVLPRATFHAVRPFAFVVRERATGLILFVGRVDDPRVRVAR